MAGFVTYCVKMILKIILYFLRTKCEKVNRRANTKRSGSPNQRRTSSPVAEHSRRDVNFSNEVSSVHSEISNDTNVQNCEWGTYAEYDVPGEEQTLDLEEQKQLLERLREENRRLHMEVVKRNKDDFHQTSDTASRSRDVCSSKMTRRMSLSVEDLFTATEKDERKVYLGSQLPKHLDVLPLKLTKRGRRMFLSVDDVSTVSDTDVDKVFKTETCPSMDSLSRMPTLRTRWMSLGVSDVQRIPETESQSYTRVGKRNQTENKNIGDLIRIIKRQQDENSHLKMYINSFMGTILSQQPSLLER